MWEIICMNACVQQQLQQIVLTGASYVCAELSCNVSQWKYNDYICHYN